MHDKTSCIATYQTASGLQGVYSEAQTTGESTEHGKEQGTSHVMLGGAGGEGEGKCLKKKKKSNTQCTESGAFQRLESTLLMP